jgi:hypothetical protein
LDQAIWAINLGTRELIKVFCLRGCIDKVWEYLGDLKNERWCYNYWIITSDLNSPKNFGWRVLLYVMVNKWIASKYYNFDIEFIGPNYLCIDVKCVTSHQIFSFFFFWLGRISISYNSTFSRSNKGNFVSKSCCGCKIGWIGNKLKSLYFAIRWNRILIYWSIWDFESADRLACNKLSIVYPKWSWIFSPMTATYVPF